MKSTGNSAVFRESRRRYRAHLRAARPDPALAALAVAAWRNPDRVVLKRVTRRAVLLVHLDGTPTILKFFKDPPWYLAWRPGWARHAWAAARTMREMGLPMPAVHQFATCNVGGYTSVLTMEAIPHAVTLREWIKKQAPRWDAETRVRWRMTIRAHWMNLLHNGVYHDDIKALNVLVQLPPGAAAPTLWWIDPESAHPGHCPTRFQIIRNLVQLNGSIRKGVTDGERLQFLREMGEDFPWVLHPSIEQRLRTWTHERLLKEKRTRCGP